MHSSRVLGALDFMPFYYSGWLTENDINFLQALPDYGSDAAQNKRRYGANIQNDISNFTFVGQILDAQDGSLDRLGWFVQPSYTIAVGGGHLVESPVLVDRFNDLDVDLPNVASNSLTWNRQQHVFGIITSVSDDIKLKFEYSINDEETGEVHVDNDEFLVQLEIKF